MIKKIHFIKNLMHLSVETIKFDYKKFVQIKNGHQLN